MAAVDVAPTNLAAPRTPRKPSGGEVASVDPRTIQLVWLSLKDRMYRRATTIRHTFRELDASGNGLIPIEAFIVEMTRGYQLSPVERHCLRLLLTEADFRKDGVIDFKEFSEMLKAHEKIHPGAEGLQLSEAEHRRLRAEGDKHLHQAVMKGANRTLKVVGGLPTNELGALTIDCPYGVLGDSERMDGVVANFLEAKHEALRKSFARFDPDGTGRISLENFRKGMKAVDQYVFDDEIDLLIETLDKKRRGFIVIDDFVSSHVGQEYMKKKAHRSHENPFQWPVNEYSPRAKLVLFGGTGTERHVQRHPNTAIPGGRPTRSTALRATEAKAKLQEQVQRDKAIFPLSIPHPPPKAGTAGGTPRLPPIASARVAQPVPQ